MTPGGKDLIARAILTSAAYAASSLGFGWLTINVVRADPMVLQWVGHEIAANAQRLATPAFLACLGVAAFVGFGAGMFFVSKRWLAWKLDSLQVAIDRLREDNARLSKERDGYARVALGKAASEVQKEALGLKKKS
jgi:hypothetical protein